MLVVFYRDIRQVGHIFMTHISPRSCECALSSSQLASDALFRLLNNIKSVGKTDVTSSPWRFWNDHHRRREGREVRLPLLGNVVALIQYYPILWGQERGERASTRVSICWQMNSCQHQKLKKVLWAVWRQSSSRSCSVRPRHTASLAPYSRSSLYWAANQTVNSSTDFN